MTLSKSKKQLFLAFTFFFSFFLSSGFLLNKVVANYSVTVGMEWTYDVQQDGMPMGTIGFEVTEVNQPYGPILAIYYQEGNLIMPDVPLDGIFVFVGLVFVSIFA